MTAEIRKEREDIRGRIKYPWVRSRQDANELKCELPISVWFYCGTEKHSATLERWLRSKFPQGVGHGRDAQGDSLNLWVAKTENDSTADRDWFVQVIQGAAELGNQ